jgi:hypothetical protein
MILFYDAQCWKTLCVNLCEIYDWINSVPDCFFQGFLLHMIPIALVYLKSIVWGIIMVLVESTIAWISNESPFCSLCRDKDTSEPPTPETQVPFFSFYVRESEMVCAPLGCRGQARSSWGLLVEIRFVLALVAKGLMPDTCLCSLCILTTAFLMTAALCTFLPPARLRTRAADLLGSRLPKYWGDYNIKYRGYWGRKVLKETLWCWWQLLGHKWWAVLDVLLVCWRKEAGFFS